MLQDVMQSRPTATEDNAIELFQRWYEEAKACESIPMANVMTLATVDETGMPAVRVVLMKECDERGFTFYTNLQSMKARHLHWNPKAALCFYWGPLSRQVRVTGEVEQVSDAEADAYFATRPRTSQIGAWAAKQSQPMEGRWQLERRIARFATRFAIGKVPRPPFWSGFLIRPVQIEFWGKRLHRLHERVLYTRDGDGWQAQPLHP